jgi:hypothetical protein
MTTHHGIDVIEKPTSAGDKYAGFWERSFSWVLQVIILQETLVLGKMLAFILFFFRFRMKVLAKQ